MGLIWIATAALWGFAEATLFFTVPDVLLTLAVVKLGLRPALRLSLITLAGALIGGTVMFAWGHYDLDGARRAVDAVPLISRAMIESAGAQLQQPDWMLNMIGGALSGLPYKVYAVEASASSLSLPLFLAGSAVIRMVRWIMTICFAALVMAGLRRAGLERLGTPLWLILWVAFYVMFYMVMAS